MYFYQFDSRGKREIDSQYSKILNMINDFSKNVKTYKEHEYFQFDNNIDRTSKYLGKGHLLLNIELRKILPESYTLLKLVIGQDLTIERKK